MDKRVIFAVAGSGKTTYIINKLDLQKRALILTYTNNNYNNLKIGISKKFGYIPADIKVMTYYDFLYNFCFKPLLSHQVKAAGINWSPNTSRYHKATDRGYFIDSFDRLYSNRITKYFKETGIETEINERVAKYFDMLFIDEVQDFGGHDFNFLKNIAQANMDICLVGDFNQHTYDTSKDGNVNGTLHDDYTRYQAHFRSMGLSIDTTTLVKSYRCNPEICQFITTKLGIHIESNRTDKSQWYTVSMEDEAERLFNNDTVVKLFYDEHSAYKCYSNNWGESKGEDHYNDVCIVMNRKSWKHLEDDNLNTLPPATKNKLYVAISRTKGDLYFVPDSMFKAYRNK